MAGEAIINEISSSHADHRTVVNDLNYQDLADLDLYPQGLTKVSDLIFHIQQGCEQMVSELVREESKTDEKIKGFKKEHASAKKKKFLSKTASKFESSERFDEESEDLKAILDQTVELETDLARIQVDLVLLTFGKKEAEEKYQRLKAAVEELEQSNRDKELKALDVEEGNINLETVDKIKPMKWDEECPLWKKIDDRFGDLKVISDVAIEFENDLTRMQLDLVFLISEKKTVAAKFETLKAVLDQPKHSDPEKKSLIGDFYGGLRAMEQSEFFNSVENKKVKDEETKLMITSEESRLRQILEEIKLFESMMDRSTLGLHNLGMMKEEIEGLKGSEGMEDIESKMNALLSGYEQLNKAMKELQVDKRKKLVNDNTETEVKKSAVKGVNKSRG